MKEGYLPKEQRKTILFLSDDFRMQSGVGVMSREIVLQTAHRYNWVQVGAAVQHPEAGKIIDMSQALSKEVGIPDAYARIYCNNGYGDPNLIRMLMMAERPSAILHFTDPRFWIWLYQMEHEIREFIPIFFYHVWDDTPYPQYNQSFYRSCDWISCISKQTYNIVKNVWRKTPPEPWQVQYIPHGVNTNHYRKLTTPEELIQVRENRKELFGDEEVDFVVFYNNRNIRRKMTGDVLLAYQHFLKKLPQDKADRCRMLMHTAPVDENGTDIPSLVRDIMPECKVVYSTNRIEPWKLNLLYNNSDVTINLASNEGFGIGTVESLSAEVPIIVNVTGGLQDQCGFKDENGNLLDADVHYTKEWGTNADGKYKSHGEWVIPCFPTQRALIGSPATPYIFDDRCRWEDAADAIFEVYNMSKEERNRKGKLGREYVLGASDFTTEKMGEKFIRGMDEAFARWKPRQRISLFKV